jgi:hypothetical protein
MIHISSPVGLIAALMVGLLAPIGTTHAGSAVIQTQQGEQITVEVSATQLRMNADANTYLVIDNNKVAVVNTQTNPPMVLDLSSMLDMTGQNISTIGAMSGLPNTAGEVSLTALNQTETHAGITGEVYSVTLIEEDGRQTTREIVVTNHPVIRQVTRHLLDTFVQQIQPESTRFLEQSQATLGERTGLLRVGEDWQVLSVDEQPTPAERFTLPAEPTSLQDMMMRALREQ